MDSAAIANPAHSDYHVKPEDIPENTCWTVQKDEINMANVVMRNRVWPGFTAFARANCDIYGGLYIGNGIKQIDLSFML